MNPVPEGHSSSSSLNGSNGHSSNHSGNHEPTQHGPHKLTRVRSMETCRVCGDGPARMHYGIPTCFGCKGFFRRTLKRTKEYTCRYNGRCVVDRYERNSCRYCRFKRCLEVGMDPKAVRPDRDTAGRSHPVRHRRARLVIENIPMDETEVAGEDSDDWIRKLPVDMRTLLMQIMNIEVANGDTNEEPKKLYPLPFNCLREILEDPGLLDGKRTEVRYEPYRKVQQDELMAIAHRPLIEVIDVVDHLFSLMDLHNTEDKVAVVKASYAPLSIFSFSAATAKVTKDRDVCCMCNYGYVPRGVHHAFEEAYHLANRIIDRALDELIEPFRAFNFKDQEIALMKAVLVLNPHIRSLSVEAAEQIADLRDRVQETLYNVVRESHPKEVASSRFGNLLLFLPTIMMLGNVMYENLQFAQSFGKQHIDPLLNELLDNIEPIEEISDMGSMRWSESTASISSLASHSSHESYDYQTNSSESQPNQQNPNPDSDPDYNLTLTADSLMRQNVTQAMDIDSGTHSVATSPDFYSANQVPKPHFFIDPQTCPMPSQMAFSPPKTTHMTGSKHVFTVETIPDPQPEYLTMRTGPSVSFSGQMPGYPNPLQSQQPTLNMGDMQQQCQMTSMGSNPQIFKSQSFPCYGAAGFPQP